MVVKDGKHTFVGFTDLGEIHDNMTKISGWYFCFFFHCNQKLGGSGKPAHGSNFKIVDYTAKNAQVVTSLLTSCNNLIQQADIRMRSHGLRQQICRKLSTGLLHDVNRFVAS